MAENLANLPPQTEAALLKASRYDTRWEGFKGFIKGALPALALGAVAGVVIGGVAAIGLGVFGTLPTFPLTSLLGFELSATAANAIGTIGMVAAASSLISGVISGGVAAKREAGYARAKNNALSHAAMQAEQQALAIPMEMDSPTPPRSRIVDSILQKGREATPSAFVERLRNQLGSQEQNSGINLH
jgi:hypothetical protein